MRHIPYEYHHLPITGGGFVTGFLFDRQNPDILYARTDIGGSYHYDRKKHKWESMINHVNMFDLSETYPIAIALDETRPGSLYIACGLRNHPTGKLAISDDYGRTFVYSTIPTPVHGNLGGRGSGMRLVLDPKKKDTLYFASQMGGLLRSTDGGRTFENIDVCGEKYLTFVWVSPVDKTIVVGTAGVTKAPNKSRRGHSLYISYNDGQSFEKMLQPADIKDVNSKLIGYVAHRCEYDGTYLYITLAQTGERPFGLEMAYSCDCRQLIGGRVLRYEFDPDGRIRTYTDITPEPSLIEEAGLNGGLPLMRNGRRMYPFGFGGISSCKSKPGLLVTSTICREPGGDLIFLSEDYGRSWRIILYDTLIGRFKFHASYQKFKYNGGHSVVHWVSCISINPFDPDEAWFNTGIGIFRTKNLTSEEVLWEDWNPGLEETVHLNLYSPPRTDVALIDIVGDLGAFAFTDVTKPCRNSFADEDGNRYITCINADYPDKTPEHVVVTPRGNWTGKTKGGLIVSYDACRTFERLKMPFGLSDFVDERLREIERPNVNSGWVAVAADGKKMVWSLAQGLILPMQGVLCSHDEGETFRISEIYDKKGTLINHRNMKVFSDRVNPLLMYGFGSRSDIYVSKDGGLTFREYDMPEDFPIVDMSLIDSPNKTEIRGETGVEGRFYLALASHGLWEMQYHASKDRLNFKRITREGEHAYCFGLGIISQGSDYYKDEKAFYISGYIGNEYGFFRSLDHGKTWEKLNTPNQSYGDINSIDGDKHRFGRFYIATGSLGVLYGDPRA